jgi:uridylate kinase
LDDFVNLVSRFDERKAKVNFPFDLVAAKLAARSRIRVDFVNGRDLKQVRAVFSGRKHAGTVVE